MRASARAPLGASAAEVLQEGNRIGQPRVGTQGLSAGAPRKPQPDNASSKWMSADIAVVGVPEADDDELGGDPRGACTSVDCGLTIDDELRDKIRKFANLVAQMARFRR